MGGPIRVIHTADLHLGVAGYGRQNPVTGMHERLEDYLATLDQIVDHAIESQADVFLVAGDIYHKKTPDSAQQREFSRRIHRLVSAGLQVVLLVGNHDAIGRENEANPLDVFAALEIPGVTLLRNPELVTVETRSGPLQVAALPHLSRSVLAASREAMTSSIADSESEMQAALERIVRRLAKCLDPDVPSLLTAHWSIDVALAGSEGQMMLGRGVTVPLAALQRPEFGYVAMGHIHKPQVWEGAGGLPSVVYPGSPDRVDFGEEHDKKGFWNVALEAGKPAVGVRLPLDVRPFHTVKADLTGAADPTADLLATLTTIQPAGAVIRLAYTIETDRAGLVDEARIREALTGAFAVAWRPDLLPAETRVRNPEMAATSTADPLAALNAYIDATPELADRREALCAASASVLASLSGDAAATLAEVPAA